MDQSRRGCLRRPARSIPSGYYNLGLAHGVPGVIALLGQACAAGVAVDKARPLLDGAVHWLLAHQEGPDGFADLGRPGAHRGAGAAGLVLRRSGQSPWRSSGRPAASNGTGVGACGAGHCPARGGAAVRGIGSGRCRAVPRQPPAWPTSSTGCFQATGEPGLAEAARSWFERTLVMRQPGRGIGGYEAWHAPR